MVRLSDLIQVGDRAAALRMIEAPAADMNAKGNSSSPVGAVFVASSSPIMDPSDPLWAKFIQDNMKDSIEIGNQVNFAESVNTFLNGATSSPAAPAPAKTVNATMPGLFTVQPVKAYDLVVTNVLTGEGAELTTIESAAASPIVLADNRKEENNEMTTAPAATATVTLTSSESGAVLSSEATSDNVETTAPAATATLTSTSSESGAVSTSLVTSETVNPAALNNANYLHPRPPGHRFPPRSRRAKRRKPRRSVRPPTLPLMKLIPSSRPVPRRSAAS